VSAKVRERLAVNKQGSQRFDMERFSLKKLNDVESKEQFRVEVSNRFAALEDLDTEVEINSSWETIRENIKISAQESEREAPHSHLMWKFNSTPPIRFPQFGDDSGSFPLSYGNINIELNVNFKKLKIEILKYCFE
jgi:hypothetical protein